MSDKTTYRKQNAMFSRTADRINAQLPKSAATGWMLFVALSALVVPARGELNRTLSDEFENPATLANWNRIHRTEGWNANQLAVWDIDTSQRGRMVMVPHTSTWFQDYRGAMAYKQVSGDVVFTTQIHVSDRDDIGDSDPDNVPEAQFSLGGIMLRAPRPITNGASDWQPGGENYVFLSLGYGGSANPQFEFEVKTTTNSISDLELTASGSESATIQLARLGQYVIALFETPTGDWTVHRRFDRADLPETLQIGLVSYTDWEKTSTFTPIFHNSNTLVPGLTPDPSNDPQRPFDPDLTAGFEFARFFSPSLPSHLAGLDLTDPNAVSDQDLVAFLGDNAVPEPRVLWVVVAGAACWLLRRRTTISPWLGPCCGTS